MNTRLVTQSELGQLRREFRNEVAAVRTEIRMVEVRRQLEMQTEKTRAAWRRFKQACTAAFLVNLLAEIGIFYWFAKLLGH
jgi:hypothetical protein